MRTIQNLSIRTRLFFAFLGVLLLYFITVGIAVTTDRNMSELMDGFYNRQFRIVTYAQSVNAGIEGVGRNWLRAITASGEEEREYYRERIHLQGERLESALRKLEHVSEDEVQLQEMLALVRVNCDKLLGVSGRMEEALDAGDSPRALQIYNDSFALPSTNARRLVMQIFEDADREAERYIERSSRNSEKLLLTVMALTVLLGGLSVGVSLWMVRSITVPVGSLRDLSEEIARGNLKATADYTSRDELGVLADSMRRSARLLSDYIGEMEKSLAALGRGDLEYRPRDIFQGDFEAVRDAINHIAGLLKQQKLRDEESRRELEMAYRSAKRADRFKSEFLSNMSHDIRTPMNAITGMTNIALANLDKPSKVQDCLKKISLSSTHLLGLINDVLDMSKIESGKMSLNDSDTFLPEVIDNIVNIVQPQIKAKKQRFQIRLQHISHERVCCDSLRLNQVLINILSNAVKFTPAGGSILLEIEETVSSRDGFARFLFRVADTGIGMKSEFVRDIFSAFTRERDSRVDEIEGSGLGMAICKKIVDIMGGSIDVASEEGKGSLFTVDLSLPISSVPEEEMKLPSVRVLVVDDDTAVCESACSLLTEMGLRVQWTDSGSRAAGLAAEALDAGDAYDVVLLERQMSGTDGVETAAAIKKAGPGISVLLTSAYDWADMAVPAAQAGIDGFLSKPLFKSKLYYGLRKVLSGIPDLDVPDNEALPTGDFSQKRVLIVEDNEINRIIALEFLSVTGIQTHCAENGAQALTMFCDAPEGYYDLILMDVQMPVMNGYDATREIRKLHRSDAASVPIFAMTANAFSEDVDSALEAGMNCHLAKPLDSARLLAEMERYLFPPQLQPSS